MRIAFFLLIISGFFGSYIFFFNDKIHLIRVFPLLLILIYAASGTRFGKDARMLLICFTVYYFYTLIVSLFNLPKLNKSDLINLTVLYLFVVAVISSTQANPPLYFKVFKAATFLFVLVSLGVWSYEVLAHKHLQYSVAAEFPTDYYYQPPTTFFVNPNDFAATFTLCIMYLLSTLPRENLKQRLMIILLIAAEIAVCYTTKARANFACFSLFLLFYFNLWKLKTVISIGLALILIFLATNLNQLDWAGVLDFGDMSESGSTARRLNLYYHGIRSVLYSYGLGFGVMGHHYYYQEIAGTDLIDPHNFILELWIGSGVIITALYILLMLHILFMLIREGNKLIIVQFVLYSFILLSSSSSLFLWPHYLFFIAYIFNRDLSHTYVEKAIR